MESYLAPLREILAGLIILAAIVGIAIGGLPRLRMNRATIAVAAAAALVAVGALSYEEALSAIDGGTLILLFSMMVLVSNLRLSGFFGFAGAKALAAARTPRAFLAAIVIVSGTLSALFLNDTMCLLLTPLVVGMTVEARRDPVPYLVAVACSANVGSAATIIGNPQNMLIGAASGIPFARFLAVLALPSLLGLAACWLVVVVCFPREFARGQRLPPPPASGARIHAPLLIKSLLASCLMLGLFLAGAPIVPSALGAAALLLITRRIKPERILKEVDFSLLVFFAGLFVVTRAVQDTALFKGLSLSIPALAVSPAGFSALAALLSNLVSNVPAVMLLEPFVSGAIEPERSWLLLAMASTFAGNLTLLGSVANLIVAEGARPFGVVISFGKYLRAGLPITLITLAIGTAWLAFI